MSEKVVQLSGNYVAVTHVKGYLSALTDAWSELYDVPMTKLMNGTR